MGFTWPIQADVIMWKKGNFIFYDSDDDGIRGSAEHPEIEARLDQALYFHDYKLHN